MADIEEVDAFETGYLINNVYNQGYQSQIDQKLKEFSKYYIGIYT
jgi:hypothetical protein